MSVPAGTVVLRRRTGVAGVGWIMHGWGSGPFLGFDTETTGVDVSTDRIVTAALVYRGPGGTRQRTWLIDPGIEIPEAASDIHGITTDHARAEGAQPREALEELAAELAAAIGSGVPVVAYNACFDLMLLEHELTRWGLATLTQRLGRAPGPVLDPLVIDRALDRYRPGKRKLVDLCQHYRVGAGAELHTAEVDVHATLDVLGCLVAAFPELAQRSLPELHELQRGWHRQWAQSFNGWRERRGYTGPGADLEWLPSLQEAAVRSVVVD